MKNLILFIICILTISLSACAQTLTKSEALRIARQGTLVQDCYAEITKSTRSTWKSYKQDVIVIGKLQSKGLVTTRSYQETNSRLDRRTHTIVDFNGTDKARKILEFKDTRSGFGGAKATVIYSKGYPMKILGISLATNKREATVLVQIKYIKSPFSELTTARYEPRNCHNKTLEEKQFTFIKYDTGWRIKK